MKNISKPANNEPENKKLPFAPIIAVVLLIVVCLIIGLLLSKNAGGSKIKITLDADQYKIGGDVKVKIVNNSDKKICFSSCFPYYIEREVQSTFESYSYPSCSKEDTAENCVNPKNTKAFALSLFSAEEGSHRLAIPVCTNCSESQSFSKEEWVYSDAFSVSK